jgi:Spy/CpxP family protein refolding chaperone
MKRETRIVRDSLFRAVLVFAVGALLVSTAAVAEARHGGKRGGHKAPLAKMLEHRSELGLTDDQVSRLEAIQSRVQGTLQERRSAVREKRRALHELMQSENVNRSEVDQRIDDLSRDMTELHRLRVHAMLEAREILTPEQRAKLREMKRDWKKDRFGDKEESAR